MNKKGVELSMNVIIISILVILVLVVLSFFFLGGTANLFQRIQGVGPDNLDTARSDCTSKCQFAQSVSLKGDSGYCRAIFNRDTDNDGIADERHHCWSDKVNIPCPGVDNVCKEKYDDAVEQIEKNA